MSNSYEFTTKFKADISNLKQGITQANKELKKITSEYKAASSAAELSGNKQDKLKAKFEYLSKALEQQNKKLQSYKDQLKTTQNYTQQLGQKEQELTKKLEDAKQKFGNNSQEVQKYQKELTQVQKEITSNTDKIDKLNISINNQQAICNNTEKEMNDYAKALQDVQDNSQNANSGVEKLGSGIGGISDAVTAASSTLDGLGDIVDGLTSKFENLLKNGISAVIEGVKSLAENAFDSGVTYESAMSQVMATMGKSKEKDSEDYEKLAKTAKEYGATTKYTATQAAEALNYLALAGYKTEPAISLLPTVLDLATAGGMDLAAASDMVTDAMSALGLEMDEATSFTDQLAKASSNSNTSVSQLGEAILTIGATARGMQNGTVELATALGVLANSSYKGEEGGTKLRNILLSLQGPTDDAAAMMDKLGVKVYTTKGKMRGINDIFKDLQKSMNGFNQEEIDNVMNTLFNTRDVGAAKYLLSACGDEFDKLYNKVNNCSGAAKDMSDTMNDNLEGSIFSIQSAIEGFGIAMYDKLETPARSVIDTITESIRGLIDDINSGNGISEAFDIVSESMSNFADQLPELIDKYLPTLEQCFIGIAKIIAEFIDYLPYLIETCLPKLLDIINKVIEGLPNFLENVLPKIIDLIGFLIENLPTILAILYSIKAIIAVLKAVIAGLGIAALISKLSALFGAGGVLASIGGVISSIGGALSSIGSAIAAFATGPVGIIIAVIAAIIAALVLLYNKCEPFKKFVDDIWSKIKEFASNLVNAIKNFNLEDFINNIKDKFGEFKDNIVNGFSEFVENVKTKLSELKDNIANKVSEIWTSIVDFFTNLPQTIAYWLGYIIGSIAAFFVNVYNSVSEFLTSLPQKIEEFLTSIPEKFNEFVENIKSKFTEFINTITTNWVQFWTNLGNKIVEFVNSIPSKIEEFKNNCISKFKEIVSGIKEKWTEFYTNAKTKISELVDTIKSIDLFEIGKNIIEGLKNGLKAKWNEVKETVGSFAQGIKDGFANALDIHSPSRYMKNFIGKNIMKGLELGITTNEDSLFSTLKSLNSNILSSFDGIDFNDLNNTNMALAGGYSNYNSSISNDNRVNYSPTFNYNKPLNSKEIYRQNKNMLNHILNK